MSRFVSIPTSTGQGAAAFSAYRYLLTMQERYGADHPLTRRAASQFAARKAQAAR